MNKLQKMISLILVSALLAGLCCGAAGSEEVIDADLTCTITLGNWPADTAPESELALFEGYRATMAKQYPNVTLVPDYYSYTLSFKISHEIKKHVNFLVIQRRCGLIKD